MIFMTEDKVTRRGYVKYAAAGIVVVAGGAAGAYYATRPSEPTSTVTTTSAMTSAMPEEKKKMLVMARIFDSVSFDPQWTFELTSAAINPFVYDSLLQYDPEALREHKLKVVGRLAKSWEVSPDKKVHTYYLNEGAKFYPTGNPADASAVKFSFDRGWNLQGPPSPFFKPVDKTEVLDDQTVRITLKAPYGPWDYFLSTQYSAIIDPVAMEHEEKGDMGSAWLNDYSAGSGPFYMDHWTREKEVMLVRNPSYWGEAPKVEKVLILNVPELAVQQMMLEKGDIDIAMSLTPDQAATYETSGRTDIVTERPPSFWMSVLQFNCNTKPLDDVKVRQAIKWALDYEGILQNIPQGHGRIIQTFLEYGMDIFDDSLQKDLEKMNYHRDLDKAKALLKEAGYADGFTIQINHQPGVSLNTRWEDLALKIAQDLSEVGITCEPRLWDAGALVSQVFEGKMPGLTVLLWGADWPDPDEFAELWMTQWGRDVNQWKPGKELEQRMDDLVAAAKIEIDFEKRKKLYKDLAQIMLEQGTFHVMYQPDELLARRSYVKDFIFGTFWFSPLLNYAYKE